MLITLTQAITEAGERKPGLLETLPPWGLVVAGLILLGISYFMYKKSSKKEDKDTRSGYDYVEVAMWVIGAIGLLSLYRGLFGGKW